jgi:crossover junction endonuclease MUS81
MIKIVIDNRETNLYVFFQSNASIIVDRKQLDIGDIQIIQEEEIIVIERKTIKDLLASIKDGRYKEQKVRLQSQLQQKKITSYFYILEGNTFSLNKKEKSILNGSLISIQLRDGIHIINTDTISETYNFIIRLTERMKIPNSNIFATSSNNIVNQTYLNSVKLRKKENIQPRQAQILMFSNIPGVSVTIGEIIINTYGNVMELFDKYQGLESEDEKERLLENITVKERRKIGLKLSKKIYNYLFKI